LGVVLGVLLLAVLVGFVYFGCRSRGADAVTDGLELGPPPEAATPVTPDCPNVLPKQFVVLDLETTGLDPELHEIIEVGAIRIVGDSVTQAGFSMLVKPRKQIPKQITQITGITQAMVDEEGQELAEVMKLFLEFIGDLPLVAFNAEFDMGFLRNAALRNGFDIGNRYTCALKMSRRAWPGLPSYRLSELAKMANLPTDDSHRALGDCKRTAIIFGAAANRVGKRIRWTADPGAPSKRSSARAATVS
jgi:DNA polymerase-3 subunit epsilon